VHEIASPDGRRGNLEDIVVEEGGAGRGGYGKGLVSGIGKAGHVGFPRSQTAPGFAAKLREDRRMMRKGLAGQGMITLAERKETPPPLDFIRHQQPLVPAETGKRLPFPDRFVDLQFLVLTQTVPVTALELWRHGNLYTL